MKATGIIRRIDDLGRVVIPKEIRRSMHIHEGDPLEIYVDSKNNEIIFIPYKAMGYDEKIKNLMEEIQTEMTWYDDRKEFNKAYDYLYEAFQAIKRGE
jgi:stage V sporulation protein T